MPISRRYSDLEKKRIVEELKYCAIDEVCNKYNVSKSTIYRWKDDVISRKYHYDNLEIIEENKKLQQKYIYENKNKKHSDTIQSKFQNFVNKINFQVIIGFLIVLLIYSGIVFSFYKSLSPSFYNYSIATLLVLFITYAYLKQSIILISLAPHVFYLSFYFLIKPNYLLHRYYGPDNTDLYTTCFHEFAIGYIVTILIFGLAIISIFRGHEDDLITYKEVTTGNLKIENNIISPETKNVPSGTYSPYLNKATKSYGIVILILFILLLIVKTKFSH